MSDIVDELREDAVERMRDSGPAIEERAADEIERLRAENERLSQALNPRFWSPDQSRAWHGAIPDVMQAFERLRSADGDTAWIARAPDDADTRG